MAAASDIDWLASEIRGLPDHRVRLKVSEWAAQKRYLTPDVTSHPGPWDNNYTPYLVEIMDCLSVDSHVEEVAIMKGHQVGATVGVGENWIGYVIEHAPGPMMFASVEAKMAKATMQLRVDRMIQQAGIGHLIRSSDARGKRTGDTQDKKEFPNGFLIPAGAQNANTLRNFSIRWLYCNEVDPWPLALGRQGQKEGSALDIIKKRTSSFETTRKILYESTPLVKQTSQINALWELGDQRRYFIPCPHCQHMQPLKWEGFREDKKRYGITFGFHEDGRLDEDSVGWICKACLGVFFNHHKEWFLPKGEWRPTAVPRRPRLRSYHIPAALAPIGMHSWTSMVQDWIEAWDVDRNRVKDTEKLRNFYNLELGLPWEEKGEAPKFERVVAHRRHGYVATEVPNEMAVKETGSPIVLLTMAADIHGDRIDYEVVGWAAGRRSYSIVWGHLEGPTDTPDLPDGPWEKLRKIIMEGRWADAVGREYMIQCTLIDAGYRPDAVHAFCGSFSGGVFPIMGREMATKGARYREHSEYESAHGIPGFNINTTLYKDRLAAWLRTDWYEGKPQPEGYPNYPADYGDDFFRQYESEEKRERRNSVTGQVTAYYWQQIGQRDNHLWDCRVYNMAALDLIVLDWSREVAGDEEARIDHTGFFEAVRHDRIEGPAPFSWAP